MFSFIRQINRCDVFVGLNCLFAAQGILYPRGPINQVLQLLILLWAVVISWSYFLDFKGQSKLLSNLKRFVLLLSLYGIFALLFGYYGGFSGRPRYLYLQRALTSLLPIFVYYEYARTGYLKESHIKLYLAPLFLITIASYYNSLNTMIEEAISGRVEFTMNVGYDFLALVPLVCFFHKKPIWQYVFMIIIMYWIVICVKRGAILIGAICFMYFMWNNLKHSTASKKILFLILTIGCIALGYKFFVSMLSNSEYFLYRYEATLEGNSSGRDMIYSTMWHGMLDNFNFIEWIAGRGGYSTFSISGAMAHNDWLEILCNNGLIGLGLFSAFILSFFKQVYGSRRYFNNYLFVAFLMVFGITFLRTLISQSIMVMTDAQNMIIGYAAYMYTEATHGGGNICRTTN